jgi:three-Cys-motif partner protein
MLERRMPTRTAHDVKPIEVHPDPCPELVVERGPDNKGVGAWVPFDKHRLLSHYLDATQHAWRRWGNRVFIDPFGGPGRIQVRGEAFTRDGGAVVAWRSLNRAATPFTRMLVGDLERVRADACAARLTALGASPTTFVGPAVETVRAMVAEVPRQGSLAFAYIDPYNLEYLSFSIIEALAALTKVDLAINFSTMDLQRNAEFEFDPARARFDGTAPGWRDDPTIRSLSKKNVPIAFFNYWCALVKRLGFEHSKEMPLVRNDDGHPIYRIVFFARHAFPVRLWGDVAKDKNRTLDLF